MIVQFETKPAQPAQPGGPLLFDQVIEHIEMLEPEGPIGCCSRCGMEFNSQMEPYSETDEMTRMKSTLLRLSLPELEKLFSVLPLRPDYDMARFVVSHIIRLNLDSESLALSRAA